MASEFNLMMKQDSPACVNNIRVMVMPPGYANNIIVFLVAGCESAAPVASTELSDPASFQMAIKQDFG